MQDHSIWEGKHPLRQATENGIVIGRITQVYTETRQVEVKTIFGPRELCGHHISKCQWVNMDANPDGDETTSIPREGSLCLVFYIGGEPFVFGFIKPVNKTGEPILGKENSRLNEGDKVISTAGGNKVVIKANGVIELESKQTLKRIMFPTDSLILDLCANYVVRTDGGSREWLSDAKVLTTLCRDEYRRDLSRLLIMVEERGQVSATTMYRCAIGPAVPGVPGVTLALYEHTIGIDGEVKFNVNPLGVPIGFRANIKPTGEFSIKSGALPMFELSVAATGATSMSINSLGKLAISETGDIEASTPLATLKMAATGDMEAKNPGVSIKASVAGEVTIDSLTKVAIKAKAGLDITSIGPVKIESNGPTTIKGLTVSIDGGGGATDNVLTFPTTLSPFTGAPLVPFSTTVMVSK